MSTWYISPSGNDTTGNGSLLTPYNTIGKALSIASSGDTILLRNGVYNERVYVNIPGITIESYSGEYGKILSPLTYSEQASRPNCIQVNQPNFTLRNVEVSGGYYYSVMLQDWRAYGQGIATGCVIDHCHIHDSGIGDVVKIVPGCHNTTIKWCDIHNPGSYGPGNHQGIDGVRTHNTVIQDCYIHDVIADYGVIIKGGSFNTVIERCLFYNIGYGAALLGQTTGEDSMDPIENPGEYESIDGIIRNCIMINCGGAGAAAYSALRPSIYNNTLIHCAQSVQGAVFIYGSGHRVSGSYVNTIPCKDVTIKNNIIVMSQESKRVFFYAMPYCLTHPISGTLFMSNNRYYKEGGGSNAQGDFWDASGYPSYPSVFTWLPHWKVYSNTDTNSTSGNPLLDDYYHLLSDSPCIGEGAVLSNVTDDFDEETRASSNDIGADQYSPSYVIKWPLSSLTFIGSGYITYIPTTLVVDTCIKEDTVFIDTELTIKASSSTVITTNLVAIASGLNYVPPDTNSPKFNIEIGPIITSPNYFGSSKIASGAIVDIFTKGTSPLAIGIGHGISSDVVRATGKIYLNIWLSPSNSWLYRITYPYGMLSPDKSISTVAEIPFIQGKYEW